MKKPLFTSLVAAAILSSAAFLVSCDETSGIVIPIPQSQDVIFQFDQVGAGTFDTTSVIGTNLDSILTANNATRDNIESIVLEKVTLTMVDSSGALLSTGNFNALSSVGASVAQSAVNAPFVTIADLPTITQNINTLILQPNVVGGFDLTPYVTEPTFKFRMNISVPNPITTRFFMKAKIDLVINAKI